MKTSVLVLLVVPFFSFFDLAAQKGPDQSIVKINGYGDIPTIGAGILTGFDAISDEVFLITAFHIVKESDSITVEFRQHRNEFRAIIYQIEQELDLAVLRVPLQGISVDFKSQVVAESSDYRISLVKVVGHPQGSYWLTGIYNFIAPFGTSRFTISNNNKEDKEIKRGISGGGVFTKNNRLMGMMLENRSEDALALDLLAIIPLLKEWKVETNLWVKPKMNFTEAAIMGGGAAGVLVSLLVFENESKDLYTTYEEHLFEDDLAYTGTSRDQVYDDAKSKHNTAIITGVVGGVVLAAGSYMLIRKLSKRKKEKRHDGLVVVPHFDMPDYVSSSGHMVTVGVTIQF